MAIKFYPEGYLTSRIRLSIWMSLIVAIAITLLIVVIAALNPETIKSFFSAIGSVASQFLVIAVTFILPIAAYWPAMWLLQIKNPLWSKVILVIDTIPASPFIILYNFCCLLAVPIVRASNLLQKPMQSIFAGIEKTLSWLIVAALKLVFLGCLAYAAYYVIGGTIGILKFGIKQL